MGRWTADAWVSEWTGERVGGRTSEWVGGRTRPLVT